MILLKTKPCPFCGGKFYAGICDDEGNERDEEYLDDPWSGISYALIHDEETGANEDCPLYRPQYVLYDSMESMIENLNKRHGEDT